ncbi:hypothetical protein [Pyxidicoccus sp. MSG2]|uniref:hypothetical protein n=1 Tax=Pyxidicoccus sp. MSG2 TaxID=2996790 RepID=UPI0022719906|nr:hypothetical protein [Pyxidicoccus sp. MSG2]MCY1018464.1 hypothetical protein [Pyxidicoccus sp. MSG2]
MIRRHVLMGALALALSGCGSEAERRTFPVELTGTLPSGANERGWTVTLESAHASVGPVRFFNGRVLLSRRAPRFDWYSLIGGTAQAHPGHYVAGDALGEVLTTATVDLLTGAPLGDASAVTGEYGSLELTLATPTASTDAAGALGGHAVRVRGTARNADGGAVRFDAVADLPAPVAGVRFEKSLGMEAGRVRIAVDLGTWLGRIDFATATDPDADGVYTFPAGSQAQNALVRGVEDTTTYVVTWEEGAAQ